MSPQVLELHLNQVKLVNIFYLEIKEFEISDETRAIIIGSDGVFEFLSNKRVTDIVMKYYKNNDIHIATDKLTDEATKCWKKEDSSIDDITAVVAFFNHDE